MASDAANIRRTRDALDDKINTTNSSIYALKFQEAEDNLPQVDELFNKLLASLDLSNSTHNNILFNSRMKVNILKQKVENVLLKRESGKREDGNIAFKCNWNDKNYKGVCSQEIYKYNQVWGGHGVGIANAGNMLPCPCPPIIVATNQEL
jgi:hypothetical protein